MHSYVCDLQSNFNNEKIPNRPGIRTKHVFFHIFTEVKSKLRKVLHDIGSTAACGWQQPLEGVKMYEALEKKKYGKDILNKIVSLAGIAISSDVRDHLRKTERYYL